MFLGFNLEEIKIIGIINIIEIIITENGDEVVNGDAETGAALSANDMVLRFLSEERNNLSNIVECIRRNLASDGVEATKVFSGKNMTCLKESHSGAIRLIGLHKQFIVNNIIFAA